MGDNVVCTISNSKGNKQSIQTFQIKNLSQLALTHDFLLMPKQVIDESLPMFDGDNFNELLNSV